MPDPTDVPLWERRFRAPLVTFPSWARHAPDRLVFASNETGAYQVYAWDRATGRRRRVTDIAIGTTEGFPTLDGAGVAWFDDTSGDERGRWMVEPFDGGGARLLVEGVLEAWSTGVALGEGDVVVAGAADDDGYAVYRSIGGEPAEVIHRHDDVVYVAGLSRDASLVCIAHAEHGDSAHLALRVLDVRSGETVGDLWDGAGFGLHAGPWSPVEGDDRIIVVGETTGRDRPAIWDLREGTRTELDLDDLPGDVAVADWWPDASSLLLVHHFEGRDQLLRYECATAHVVGIAHTQGSILDAAVRPDGEVWYQHTSGALAPTVRSASSGEEVVGPDAEPAPAGHPYRSWHFTNEHGERVHGFVVEPPGDGPHPTVVLVHGGPHWLWGDAWRPEVPAWVDHGFAVALVNYRGSTGYGREWRDTLLGNPGFPELEDILAGVDDLVAAGVADPDRLVLAGGSWGGYITLLGLGRHPDRWRAGVAIVPVADYVAAYEDEAPGLKSLDRMLFGGTPDERPELYRERSPLTYVDDVAAPVLLIAGDNDSRCPIRQVLNYVEVLERLGKEHKFHRFDAGHGSYVIDERVEHMAMELDWVLPRVLG